MKFTKMHGCGNDYIYINGFEETIENESETAKKLSDRHFGVGGDGLIIINPSDIADFEMVMYNADGSRGAMCGNAIRCVAKYVYEHKMIDKTSMSIASMGKVKYIDLTVKNDVAVSARVDMGTPDLSTKNIPANFDTDTVINREISIGGRVFNTTLVSTGNPHAVSFIDEDPKDFDIDYYGKLFEQNTDLFPDRINAEFAKIIDRHNIKMRVYERGTGETLACGTGASATAIAAIINGYCTDHVTVHLLGGELEIEWSGNTNDSFYMTGPAETVFTGEIEI